MKTPPKYFAEFALCLAPIACAGHAPDATQEEVAQVLGYTGLVISSDNGQLQILRVLQD